MGIRGIVMLCSYGALLITGRLCSSPWLSTPGSASWQLASPWACHSELSFLQGMHRGFSVFTCSARGLSTGAGRVDSSLMGLAWHLWIVRGWSTSAWWGLRSILPWEKVLLSVLFFFFISSGKNATSVQKWSKTFYEWVPLNYNVSKFPKAVNRISCIVGEVLNMYIHTGSSYLGAAVLNKLLGQAFFFSVSQENAIWLRAVGGGVKIVLFDTLGLFINVNPTSLCRTSAVVKLQRKNEISTFVWVMVLQWT